MSKFLGNKNYNFNYEITNENYLLNIVTAIMQKILFKLTN